MKFSSIFILLLISGLLSCNQSTNLNHVIPENNKVESVKILLDSIKVEGDLGDFSVQKSEIIETNGVQLITFKFTSDKPSELQPATIHFNFPSIDVNGYWNPKISIDKVNYFNSGLTSKASRNAPILAFYNGGLWYAPAV